MKTADKDDKRFKAWLAIAAVAVLLAVVGIVLLGNYWMAVRRTGQDSQPPHQPGSAYSY